MLIYFEMLQNNTPRPLTETFYQKLTKVIEACSDSDALIWNQQGTGVILIDEEALDELLMELFGFHLQTFRKMMMIYGFRKLTLQSTEEYIHSDLEGRKLIRRSDKVEVK
ncbi:MAG: hypothetical protein JST59_02485 [Actinobacteria bacterium]|nr:hypothetical protein [Actinomycetota bacterium]